MAMTILDFENLWAMQPQAFSSFAMALHKADEKAESRIIPADAIPEPMSYELVNGIAIIPIEGVILRYGDPYWGSAGQDEIRASLNKALADPVCRGILFNIHSPGGQARGVKELADIIAAASNIKPCAAFVDGLCASAAYWLASATGQIYAGPSSEIGSIGVILRHMDQSGLNSQWGLNFTYITAGAYKAVGNPDNPLSESDRDVLQNRVNAIYDMFCGDVAAHMGLDPANRGKWADGRDFLAAEAEELGLVTSLVSDRNEVIAKLLQESHMDKAELAQKHPELLASIQDEAAQAAIREQTGKIEAAVKNAVDNTLAIMETACGKEEADKVRSAIQAGLSAEQFKAAAAIIGHSGIMVTGRRDEMLEAIKKATPAAVAAEKAENDNVQAFIQRMAQI